MVNWHIGCSGFHYKHWKGSFYPEKLPQSKWFDYYCRFFNTLELNVTFYRFPQLSFLQNWYKKSPAEFRFAVKVPRAITHYKQFSGTADMLSGFYGTVTEGLAEKLGCILFQLPPRSSYSADRLENILSSLDNSFLNVVEFRHPSWWRDDVYTELAKHNISFCGMSHPTLPASIVTNTSLVYYRLHGEDQLYSSNYDKARLTDIYQTIKTRKKIKDAYIYFNNDVQTYAVYNALELAHLAGLNKPEEMY